MSEIGIGPASALIELGRLCRGHG